MPLSFVMSLPQRCTSGSCALIQLPRLSWQLAERTFPLTATLLHVCWYEPCGIPCALDEIPSPITNITATVEDLKIEDLKIENPKMLRISFSPWTMSIFYLEYLVCGVRFHP